MQIYANNILGCWIWQPNLEIQLVTASASATRTEHIMNHIFTRVFPWRIGLSHITNYHSYYHSKVCFSHNFWKRRCVNTSSSAWGKRYVVSKVMPSKKPSISTNTCGPRESMPLIHPCTMTDFVFCFFLTQEFLCMQIQFQCKTVKRCLLWLNIKALFPLPKERMGVDNDAFAPWRIWHADKWNVHNSQTELLTSNHPSVLRPCCIRLIQHKEGCGDVSCLKDVGVHPVKDVLDNYRQ